MHRRTARLLAATTVLGLTLTACGGGGGGGGGEAQDAARTARGPITVWYSNNEQEVAWGKAMVASWNSAHADQQVTGQEIPAGKSSEEVIGAAITAGTAPCLVFNTAPSAVGQFQRQGGLVNLASFPDGSSYITDRSGDVAKQYQSSDGGFYQLPWKSNPVMIFYNKDLFKKAGLDPDNPQLATYDQFLDAARKIKSSGAAKYAINPAPTSEFYQSQFDFIPLYSAESGGKQIVADGKATFNDPQGIAVANFWKTIYAEGLAGKEAVQGDAFASKVAAMSIVGPWAVAVYKGKVNWGAVPVPTSTGMPIGDIHTFSDAKNIGLFSACKNQGTAWDVLKFATSAEQDSALLTKTGQMPIRKDLSSTYADYFTKNPSYKQFGDLASRTVEVPGGANTVEMLQTLRDAYTKSVISGQGDVTQTFNEAADKVTSLAGRG
ncbi:extracellular solute-binding protein [Microlunatus flavus]|uniref:Multiple sugar transport system substrate-binding protein n=1 Tax=Microlunatus flavus TaxID=1036181 RepID=A0A1H9ALP5_9ACTN|nr:extracellular solute-binding protein [Microlunatus flavus]SEP77666.1 multiple sugar transport system substrate-binding protein [Microlunatus flavus]